MRARRRTDVVVGAVVLLGIALVVFGVIWLKGSGFGREEMTVQARFRDAGQLLDGSSVKLHGVLIGRVGQIGLDPSGGGVIVTMKIQSDAPLPEDPAVLLSPESMFGDWQAEIVARNDFPEYEYAEARDPAVLPGYTLPDISRLTQVAHEIAENMATLSQRFEIAFTQETADNIRLAIANIQQVSEELTGLVGGQQRAINEVAANLKEATKTLGEAAQSVQRAIAEIETAVGQDRLVTIVANVERTTARTDSLTRELLSMSRDLREAAVTADSTMRAVGDVASRLRRGEGSLGRMLQDTMLFVGLRESSIELQALLKDIRQNPKRYINVRVF
jgi:phospholipid/cholesterol/gamma-HCH transport system substrate-binding protein